MNATHGDYNSTSLVHLLPCINRNSYFSTPNAKRKDFFRYTVHLALFPDNVFIFTAFTNTYEFIEAGLFLAAQGPFVILEKKKRGFLHFCKDTPARLSILQPKLQTSLSRDDTQWAWND